MRKIALLALALPLLATPSAADGLDARVVPADASWYAHIDVEALLQSQLMKAVEAQAGDEWDEGMEEMEEELGFNPLDIVRSVTFYGEQDSHEGGVAVVSTNSNLDSALSRLEEVPGYEKVTYNGHKLLTFGEGGEHIYACIARNQDRRVVFASEDRDRLIRAIKVAQGVEPNLNDRGTTTPAARPSEGSIFFASLNTNWAEFADFEPASRIAKLANSMVVDIGAKGGDMFATLALNAENVEEAKRIGSVVQGAMALVGLVTGGEDIAPLENLIRALDLEVSGSQVRASFSYDMQRLIEDLQALEEWDH